MKAPSRTASGLLGLGLGMLYVIMLFGCSGPDRRAERNACLYAAVKAYPGWGNDTPLLDYLVECKDLPQEDKTELRQMVTEFVAAANARSSGKDR